MSTDSHSPQEKRGSAQDYTQFEERGEVPESWAPDPKLERSDAENGAPRRSGTYHESGGGGLYDARTRKV